MITILMYHQIAVLGKSHDPMGLAVLPQVFDQQMAYLHRFGYQCLSLNSAVIRLKQGLAIPKKSFVLTFDDGYQDIYTTVQPILSRYNFTATIFLVTQSIESFSNWEGQKGLSTSQMMSWKQVRELASIGFTIGSHTMTHSRLNELNENRARLEIQKSKEIIEDQLGTSTNFFSYPYSSYNLRIQQMVDESGYISACGGNKGKYGLFNLWRIQCDYYDSLFSFALKSRGWYHRLFWFREQSSFGLPLRLIIRGIKQLLRKSKPSGLLDN